MGPDAGDGLALLGVVVVEMGSSSVDPIKAICPLQHVEV